MPLGVLDKPLNHDVPGTAFLGGDWTSAAAENDPHTKYDHSGDKPVVLVPQPSDDPSDPLNWPLWQRDIVTAILCLVSILAATLSPLLAANTITLADYWDKPFTKIALLTGWHLLGVGVAGIFCVPCARIWGKRHLFVLGTLLLGVSSAWGGAAPSYNSLLWSRIVQGFAVAPFESQVNAAIGDLYYVHQRGKRMAFTNFALFGGAFLTPVIVGKMTSTMSWRWSFYFIAIFSGAMLPVVFFFVPETVFHRPHKLDAGTTSQENGSVAKKRYNSQVANFPVDPESGMHVQDTELVALGRGESLGPPVPVSKATFLKKLALFNGRKTNYSMARLFLRPFPLLFHPAILWGMLTQGMLIGWTVVIGVVIGAIFMGPPLWFDEVKAGYMYTGAFVGAITGFVFAGSLADFSAKFLTKRNDGIYEPEYRIVLVVAQAIVGVLGIYMFGYSSAHVYKYHWFWPSFFFGLEVMGMVLGSVASALYLVDAYREIAVESFTCLLLFKNFFSFALTWKAYDWMNQVGVWKLFWIAGTVQVFVCLLSVPMYVFGKRGRWFMHQHNVLEMAGLESKQVRG